MTNKVIKIQGKTYSNGKIGEGCMVGYQNKKKNDNEKHAPRKMHVLWLKPSLVHP